MTTDQQLLSSFAQSHSQDAFRQLLLRHQDWVYSVCLRRLPEAGLAEDAAQAVFLALAQQAPKLAKKLRPGQLEPWLHQAAKYAAANLRRSHARRQRHEQEAAAMKPEAHTDPAAWQEIETLLEPALDHLSAPDRQAILLRFYRQLTHAEIATTLSITEEAAKKRVNRALDRLRNHLTQTDATGASLAIGPLLVAHAVHPAPVLLATKLAVAGTTAAVTSEISALSKGVLHMFHLAKLKLAALTVAASAAVLGAATVPLVLAQNNPPENPSKPPTLSAIQTGPATTNAAGGGPVEALRAYSRAAQFYDVAAFANVVDMDDPDSKIVATVTEKLLSAASDLRTSLLKKFDTTGVDQILDVGLNLGHAPEKLLNEATASIEGDNAVVTIRQGTNTASSIPLVRRSGKWKVNLMMLQHSGDPSARAKKASLDAMDSIAQPRIVLITAIRKDVDDGKLTTLAEVLARLQAPPPRTNAAPKSMPAATGQAIYATPIDALRAFNHALATLDAVEFANAIDNTGDDEKTGAAQFEQLLTAGYELRIDLIKKFPDDEVTAAINSGLGIGLLPLTSPDQPNAQVPYDTFSQGNENEVVVLLVKGSTGLPLIKRDGSWHFQFFKLQKWLRPANVHDLPNSTPAAIQAQVDAKVATINATRIAFEKGTLTNLEDVPARLQNASAAPASQP